MRKLSGWPSGQRASAVALLLALIAPGSALAQAGEPGREPAPKVPDGFIVTPGRPAPSPLPPDARDAPAASPQGERQPRQQPHGGCRYDEQKLELIV